VWLLTIFAAFGGFMFGYDTGVINGVKDTDGFRQTFLSGSRNRGNGTSHDNGKENTLLGLVVSTFSVGVCWELCWQEVCQKWQGEREPSLSVEWFSLLEVQCRPAHSTSG
jgi:hypothetical protein